MEEILDREVDVILMFGSGMKSTGTSLPNNISLWQPIWVLPGPKFDSKTDTLSN